MKEKAYHETVDKKNGLKLGRFPEILGYLTVSFCYIEKSCKTKYCFKQKQTSTKIMF